MNVINFIRSLIENGYISTGLTTIIAIACIALQISKNKLNIKLSNEHDTVNNFVKEVKELKNDLDVALKYIKNSDQMVSATVDMIYLAYSGSKLPIEYKIQIQKFYDMCPDGLDDAKNKLEQLLSEQATEEQVAAVEATEKDSAVNAIISKLTEE